MKKILVYGISNEKSGISEYMMNINEETIKNDIYFDYIIKGNSSIYEPKINSFKENVFYYKYSNPWQRIKNIYKIIKDNSKKYDYFYYNTSGTFFIIPILIAHLYKYKIIVHAHNTADKNLNIIYRLLNIFNRLYVNKIANIKFQCSDLAGKWIFGKKANNVIQINNPINIEKYSFDELTRKKLRKEFNFNNNDKVLICVGRVEYPKNQLFLIKLMKDLDKNYHLLIVGSGKDLTSLKQFCETNDINNVYFLGNRNNINELLSLADIFLLSSFYEGFPISAIEAQTCGLPCILSNYITRQANITNNVTFLPINNYHEWIKNIKNITSSNTERKKYANIVKEKGFEQKDISNRIVYYINKE